MGKKLNSVDILGTLESEEKPVSQKKKHATTGGDKTTSLVQRKKEAAEAARGKPSPYFSDLREKLRDQVQFNFGKLPRFIAEGFSEKAAEAGMNKREYFYHLLRENGVKIPPYHEMDGRKL